MIEHPGTSPEVAQHQYDGSVHRVCHQAPVSTRGPERPECHGRLPCAITVTMVRRIAFAVGDTVGHVQPALAIAEAYDSLDLDVDVRLFAAPGGPASRLAAAAGRPLEIVSASALARASTLARIDALARVARGIPAARGPPERAGTRLVIGTGGYGSGSVLLAARSMGLATAIVEPNATPGLANTLLRPWANAPMSAPRRVRSSSRRPKPWSPARR